MSRNSSQQSRETRHGLADLNYTQYLKPLKSKDYRQQLAAAKEFYAFLLNELKKVKRDDETSFVDNLIPTIRELVNENNQNISDKQACIYIITSIINLDNINVRVRRRHQTSLFRWLKNLLTCPDPIIIHMASRAMGRYAQAGVDCDLEFRSGLETMRIEAKRYQGILLIRELSLAHPQRLFLNSATFFENIMLPICDHNAQIRYEAVELFRLSLSICVSRESLAHPSMISNSGGATMVNTTMVNSPSSAALTSLHRIRRTSTSSSFGSISQDSILLNTSSTNNTISPGAGGSNSEDKSLAEIKTCFKNSLKNLESLLKGYSSADSNSSMKSQGQPSAQSTREDKLHGYLLIILEVVKFACLEFEKQIEKYLLTYNLYHQRVVHHSSNTAAHVTTSSSSSSSTGTSGTDINLIEKTARSCEELHAANMIKLLPQGCFDPLHSNDPFMFLFKRERIHVGPESATCKRLLLEKYDRVVKACLEVISTLSLFNVNPLNSSSGGFAGAAGSMVSSSLSIGASFTSTFTSSSSSGASSPSVSSAGSNPFNSPPSAYRCIQETILSLLPRLARFNQTRFNSLYIDDTLKFLSGLNANTQFFLGSSSSSSSNTPGSSAASSISSVSASASATKRTLQQSVTSSSGVSSSNTLLSSPASSSSSSSSNQPTHQLQINMIISNSSFCLGTLKSDILFCMGFMSLALENSSNDFLTFARRLVESLKSSPLLKSKEILRKKHHAEREAQVNELNSIMAFIVMFARSIGSNADKENITESIMSLLEPLMVCSGGVTYTMRYFLNEISVHIPELKLPIHENLLKILAHILTGRQLSQIIQAVSQSASHLIQSNNLYSLMSNIGQYNNNNNNNVNQPVTSNTNIQQEFMPSQMEIESIVQALQTLRAFEFSSLYVIAFLRYCVDFYLAHESRLVKIEATLTTSRLLSSLISTLRTQDSRSLISIISCALRKLLICSITDYEPDVRYHVLNSLDNDTRFNMFVSLPENLNILFMCVRDEKVELRELSASMISRLSASNSAYILPFIRKILMQLLTEVDIYPDISQREKSVRLIGYLLSHAPRLVNLYVKPLLDCLHSKLCEYRHDVPFASSIVTVVGQLASQSSAETIQHFDTVIPFLIESMQDFYYVQLKHTSLWALSQIIANTGYCIEPYKKYPHLLEILLGFLQTETSVQIRRETIRVLGLLGAIDAFEYKKNVLKSKRDELLNAAVSAAQQQQLQIQNQIAAAAVANQNNGARVDQPGINQDPNIPDNPMVYLQPGVTAAAQAAAIAANLNQNNIVGNNNNQNNEQSLDPIEMLISMNANNSLDEYYPALAIHLIMKTIKNSVSIEVRRDAIPALVFAMRTLDNRCVNYVELVIPPFLDLIKTMNDNLVIDLIVQLGFLVGYIRKHIEPYLNRILNIIEHYWNLPDVQVKMVVALIDLVQAIANVMDIEFKRYLPQILPLILKQLQVEIKDGSCTNTPKLMILFRSCTCCLENYIHLILSEFSEYLTMQDLKISNHVKQEILYTIYVFARQLRLSDNCAILFQSFIKILENNVTQLPAPSNTILANNPLLTQSISQLTQQQQSQPSQQQSSVAIHHHYHPQNPNLQQFANTPPILSITYLLFSNSNTGSASLTSERLNHTTDLATLTLETLYLLARQMGGRFFVFAPMFDRILIRNSNYSRLYEQLMINCREASFHTFWANQNFVSASNPANQPNSGQSNTQANASNQSTADSYTPFRANQQVSFGNLKVCIDQADQLTSREGWRESFRRLMSTVVQETPISTLRACSIIPYETTPPDLFNACFISIWVKISEKEQNDLITYLELALRNSFVPETIKMILNLTEFIERCDVGQFLPLDYQLLAEKAFQVRAYAKALHYVEEQFHACMSVSSISNNLGGLFTGVGGVSGAGGGYNITALTNGGNGVSTTNMTTRRMLSNLAAMSRSQQQQTLIYLLEQLVTLNHELQRTEAAMGVLDFASKYLQSLDSQTRVKERWYEKLHQWQKAVNIYERELKKSGGASQTTVKRSVGGSAASGGGAVSAVSAAANTATNPSESSEAFAIVHPDDINEARLELLMGRMRCLKGLGEWRSLVFSCSDLFQIIQTVQRESSAKTTTNTQIAASSASLNLPQASQFNSTIEKIVPINPNSQLSSTSSDPNALGYLRQMNQQQMQQLKEKVSEMGAAACWGLGDWQQMKTFVECLPETTYDGALYRSVLALSSDVSLLLGPGGDSSSSTASYDHETGGASGGANRERDPVKTISDLIEQTRDLLDADLTSMATQSYERSYQAIIEAQVLAELEEIVKYKKIPGKRDWLIETWWKRLQGCERSLEYWHRLLLVRSIVLTKQNDIKPWLKFSSLCQKTGHLNLARQILDSLLNTYSDPTAVAAAASAAASSTSSSNPLNPQQQPPPATNVGQIFYNTSRNEELCKYAYLKFLYASGDKRTAIDRLREFSANLAVQYQQFLQHQQQQQQQINMAQLGAQLTNPQVAAGGAGVNSNITGQQIPSQPQLPTAFHLLNTRDIQKRRGELEILLSKCYLKLGQWCQEMENLNIFSIEQIITYFKLSRDHNSSSYKSWQAWAYANYEAIHFYRSSQAVLQHQQLAQQQQAAQQPQINPSPSAPSSTLPPQSVPPSPQFDFMQQRIVYVRHAIKGFLTCIKLSSAHVDSNCLQDTLRLLTLWFDHGNTQEIYETLSEGIKTTPMEIWLQVIPQLIARIDTNKQLVARLIHNLLTEFGRIHPQALVYRLILASKTASTLGSTANSYQHYGQNNYEHSTRNSIAIRILNSMREHNSTLVEQAKLVSEELIRVAILWHEMWHESLEEASKLHFSERNTQGMLDLLEGLHNLMERGATTNKETAFLHAYGRDLNDAREFCRRYRLTHQQQAIDSAWDKYYSVFKRITKQLPQMTTLELSYVSPRLMIARDLELAVPGTYEPNKPLIRIKAFNANIQVICSKQRPRKISIFGSNGCEYVFLLKGHEDLRQDERVMQIFGLVNNLLLKNHDTARRDLAIQRYSVIPLSQNSGLLEWLLNCDTLHSLIREYREKKHILLNLEHKIIQKLAPDYDHLTPIHKVQIFEMAIESTTGNDLAEILWHKSLTAEKWLERRTNYTRSLAVMSMVGYVLGLGDRHPSNLMLDRTNGKIIHVDFGDCFETAMTREKFPEKIPFRLTRMLKNAMEVTGIEGTFRRTCESVMRVLRDNRDSVMAVLEAFVYDPLVYWRLVEATGVNQAAAGGVPGGPRPPNPVNDLVALNNAAVAAAAAAAVVAAGNATGAAANSNNHQETEETNRKAIQVLNRVKDKLTGRDFGDEVPIDEARQIDLLISQATSSENLCQCFIGWCAWW